MTKEDLFKIELATAEVEIPQGKLTIKEFTTSAREQFEMMAVQMQTGGAKNMKAKLISISVIKDDGNRMFGDDEVGKISQMPSAVTEKIFNAILDLNGMGTDALSDAEGN